MAVHGKQGEFMRATETRPLPTGKTVVIRSAFFALAKIGAELHSYDEQNGIITATVGWIHIGAIDLFEQGIEISVEEREGTSLLKLVSPNKKSAELLQLIATYVVEGAKAIKDDAHIQWFELLKEEEKRRQKEEKKQVWNNKVSALLQKIPLIGHPREDGTVSPANTDDLSKQNSGTTSPSNSLMVLNPETSTIAPLEPKNLSLTIPSSPGMLIKNRYGQIFEIQVDTVTCVDRTHYLAICPYCSATNLQGSWFCFRCGKQLTVKAASEELKRLVVINANSSLWFGLFSVLPSILILLIEAIPLIMASSIISLATIITALSSSFSSLTLILIKGLLATTLPTLVFVALPSFWLGRKAISHGQQALLHLNLNFYADKTGKKRATFGQGLGYLGMYIGIGLFILVLLSGYLRGGN